MTPRGEPRSDAAPHAGLVLVTCMLASSLSFVDGSVVNVSLPFIGDALGRSPAALQWVVDIYLLPLSALILLGGAAGDQYGRGRLLGLGVALFGAASLACALAPGYPTLLAGRAVQGVGAAVLLPNSLATLAATFRGEARARAIGAWSALGAAAAAVGPVLGGWLADSFGWRSIFLINLPLALAAGLLAWRYVRHGGETDSARARPFDAPGGLLATVGLGLLAWGLTLGSGPDGWSAAALGCAGGGALALAAFAWVERRRGDRAMAPPALFASPAFLGLSLLTFLVYGALGGLLVALPAVLIRQYGFHGAGAGVALLPLPLLLAFGSPLAGAAAGRIGSKPLLVAGALLLAAGLLLLWRVEGAQARYAARILPALLVIAMGVACTAAPLTTAVLASVDDQRSGAASGLNSALARAGGLVATALLGGVLAHDRGPALLRAFHLAAAVGAGASLVGALCAAFLLTSGRPAGPSPEPTS